MAGFNCCTFILDKVMSLEIQYKSIGGCNHGCDFRKPVGMATTGGCKCIPRVVEYDVQARVDLRKKIHIMRDYIKELEDKLKEI